MSLRKKLRDIFDRHAGVDPKAAAYVRSLSDGKGLPKETRAALMQNSAIIPFRTTVRAAWDLFTAYLFSEEKWQAWQHVGEIVLLCGLQVASQIACNIVMGQMIESMSTKNPSYIAMMGIALGAGVANGVITNGALKIVTASLKANWQRWLTENMADEWMGKKNPSGPKPYLAIETAEKPLDNTDQRLTETVKKVVDQLVDLASGALVTTVSLAAFAEIIREQASQGAITIFHYAVPPGVALAGLVAACTATGIIGTHGFGKRLTNFAQKQLNFDGDLRFDAMHIRSHGVEIDAYGGEDVQLAGFKERNALVIANQWETAKRKTLVDMYNVCAQKVAAIAPYAVAVPLYIAGNGATTWGTVAQLVDAFNTIQGNCNWFITQYPIVADVSGSVNRLYELKSEMQRIAGGRPQDSKTPAAPPVPSGGTPAP